MEVCLSQLLKEANKAKYASVHKSCQDALDLLSDRNVSSVLASYQLRERCLLPVQLALESKSVRLCVYAVGCIQSMLSDERFQSSMESEQQSDWLPMQILAAIKNTSALADVVQIDLMKLLLNMTVTSSWCMNAPVIIAVIKIMFETYSGSGSSSVRTAAKAAFTQLLSALHSKLTDVANAVAICENAAVAEFTSDSRLQDVESCCSDYMLILNYLCDKLGGQPCEIVEPLLLEGILLLLRGSPPVFIQRSSFHDLVWQKLCPALIHVLANPVADKLLTNKSAVCGSFSSGGVAGDDMGRGSGCSTAPPSIQSSSAKAIYSIAVELVRCVGRVASLCPVIESLFHRILMYRPPVHRFEALQALQPLLSHSQGLTILAGPISEVFAEKTMATAGGNKRKQNSELSLLKLIVDSLQECCHCTDFNITFTSISLINDLLNSVKQLVNERGPNIQIMTKNGSITRDQDEKICESHAMIGEKKYLVIERNVSNADESEYSAHDQDVEYTEIPQDESSRSNVELAAEATIWEHTSAISFIRQLVEFIPKLAGCNSCVEADQRIQEYASTFCAGQAVNSVDSMLNADAVYVTVYSTLRLSAVLTTSGYFMSKEKSLPMSEQQFIEEILGIGVLMYVSRAWLSDIFHHVITNDLLQGQLSPVVVTLLADIDGFKCGEVDGKLLSVKQNKCSIPGTAGNESPETFYDSLLWNQGTVSFARRILTTCWDGILDILSVLITGRSACGVSGSLALMFNAREESRRARQAICTSLEGLKTAAMLSSTLGLHDLCGAVFEHLAAASCAFELDGMKRERLQHSPLLDKKPPPSITSPVSGGGCRSRLVRLHAAHALCMNVLLGSGLELGSHTGDCWKHIFKCCAHISELEHIYFSYGDGQSTVTQLHTTDKQQSSLALSAVEDLEANNDSYSPLPAAAVDLHSTVTVTELIQQFSAESGWDNTVIGGGVLSASQSSTVLCRLSQEVDRLFEDAAKKLNLKSFLGFLSELCRSSCQQLSLLSRRPLADGSSLSVNALHLHRFDDLLTKCMDSDRPRLHVMCIWNVVSPHLVEAACHSDTTVSKRAVSCMHNVITRLLNSQAELPHFHFNESLCKSFENLLYLELCDGDIQDQVVCSVCELVEACPSNIKSGWKPLFGALRAVKIQYTTNEEVNEARQRHIFAVLDVFNVFLATDNVEVFANAAIDCILCLLKYIRGPGEFEMRDGDDDDSSESDYEPAGFDSNLNLCLPALQYLRQCCDMIALMLQLPKCPIFSGAQRIHVSDNHNIDSFMPSVDMNKFSALLNDNSVASSAGCESITVTVNAEPSSSPCIQHCDAVVDPAIDRTRSCQSVTTEVIDVSATSSWTPACSPEKQDSGTAIRNDYSGQSDACSANYCSIKSHDELTGCRRELQSFKLMSSSKPAVAVETSVASGTHRPDEWNCSSNAQKVFDDDKSGALHVFYLAIEGLTCTVSACPKSYQPQTLDMLFVIMRSAAQVPGPLFALHCVGSLLLPTQQSWLRRGNGSVNGATGMVAWDSTTVANFKHYAGLCIDLIVEFIIELSGQSELEHVVELMLQQQLTILTDCIAQPVEAISRLGCSCFRHCLLNCGAVLTESMWLIVSQKVQHAFDSTLYPLSQLMAPFHENSNNFYGDVGQVKVAVRQDSSPMESARLHQLAHQVFLLDNQKSSDDAISSCCSSDKSYVFLFYSKSRSPESSAKTDANPIARVPLRSLIVGLVSHQLLIQMVGSLLLSGTGNVVPAELGIVSDSMLCGSMVGAGSPEKDFLRTPALPGFLRCMSSRVVFSLLHCLRASYHAAVQFDARPGLKFLVQKVSCTDVAANLYRQAGVVYTLYMHTLLEIGAKLDDISCSRVRHILESCDGSCHIDAIQNSHIDLCTERKLCNSKCQMMLNTALLSSKPVTTHVELFIHLLKSTFDEACSRYIDLFLEREGPSAADQLSDGSLLVFLLEDVPLPQLPRERTLSELVAEKVLRRQPVNCVTSEQTRHGTDLGLQPPLSPVQTTHGHKPPVEDRIYTVATDHTINSVVSEYRKRKQAQLMPKAAPSVSRTAKSTLAGSGASKTVRRRSSSKTSLDPVDQQIEEQQHTSIMKDGEARLRSSVELMCNMLQLLNQLASDVEYQALLPTSFACVVRLTGHCRDRKLREALARWTFRLGSLYQCTAPGDSMTDIKY